MRLAPSSYFITKKITGINLHNGSEKNTLATYLHMFDELLFNLQKNDIPINHINLGGGLHNLTTKDLSYLINYLDKSYL